MHKRFLGVVLLLFVFCAALPAGQILADSLDVSASVNAILPPNGEVPIVETPDDNSTQTLQNIFITGQCIVLDPTLIVVLLRNNQTIGTGPCLPDGTFRILVGLVQGVNIIVPMFMTVTGQTSGFGQPLRLIYNQPSDAIITGTGTATNNPEANSQECSDTGLNILLNYDFITYSDTTPSQLSYAIKKGCKPYVVTINWGDGTQTTAKIANNDAQTARHQYDSVLPPAALTITAVDASGIKAVQSRALVSFKKGIYIPAAVPLKPNSISRAQKTWVGVGIVSILVLLANHFGFLASTSSVNTISKPNNARKKLNRR